MKPVDRVGRREREVIEARRQDGYVAADWLHFDAQLQPTLRALLDRLLPGVPLSIDLAAFVDRHAAEPMGRGDRPEGVPPMPDLLVQGVAALAEDGFVDMPEAEQRALIARLRRGEDSRAHSKPFVDRLLDKALAGYLAHPDTWTRIGFNGPAYPEGYAWIGTDEAAARHDRRPGWDRL